MSRGATGGGEVGQVHGGQQRIAEAGAECEQFGSGPHGRLVIQGRKAHLAQLGPPVLGHDQPSLSGAYPR